MKLSIVTAAALLSMLSMIQAKSDSATLDALTHLPLPNDPNVLRLGNIPMAIPDVPMCKSTAQMNFYTARSGKVDVVIAWYLETLKGFKHTHGYGSGRSQDTFYNAAGTLMVSITSKPAAQGRNADVYSIIYTTIHPGVSEKVIVGTNIQKVDCT